MTTLPCRVFVHRGDNVKKFRNSHHIHTHHQFSLAFEAAIGWFWIEAFPPRFSPFLFVTGLLALCLMMCSYLRQRTSGVGRGQASTRASERKNESGVKIRARTARQAAPHPRKSRQVHTLLTRFSILYFIASGRLLDLLFRDFFAVYPPRRKSCTAPTARPVVKLRANSSAHASCTPQFVPPFRTGEGSVP